MDERCYRCGQKVPAEHICRLVPDGEHVERICLMVCRECLARTGMAYWQDERWKGRRTSPDQ